MFVLDTNIISETYKLTRNRANPHFTTWINQQKIEQLYTTSITMMEIDMGILRLEHRNDVKQAMLLRQWFEKKVLPVFDGRILDFDTPSALICSHFHVPNPRTERDAMIGAIAKSRGFLMVTDNVKDFKPLGIELLNPFEPFAT